MKKILTVTCAVLSISSMLMSCAKEYNCECDGYSVIVEANSSSDAQTTCNTKGTNCKIK